MMDALEKYVDSLSTPESELLRALDHETHMQTIQPRMLSGHIQGKLLEMFVRMLRPRSILEIGTFTGYSALSMAAGLDEGATLDTIEVDDELEELAQRFFDRSPCGGKIRLHIGSALDIARRWAVRSIWSSSTATNANIPPTTGCSWATTRGGRSWKAALSCWRTTSSGRARW